MAFQNRNSSLEPRHRIGQVVGRALRLIGSSQRETRVARPHVDAGRLARIAIDLGARAFSLVRHKQRYRTSASEAFETQLPRRAGGDILRDAPKVIAPSLALLGRP